MNCEKKLLTDELRFSPKISLVKNVLESYFIHETMLIIKIYQNILSGRQYDLKPWSYHANMTMGKNGHISLILYDDNFVNGKIRS